jgi:hypothetical protein
MSGSSPIDRLRTVPGRELALCVPPAFQQLLDGLTIAVAPHCWHIPPRALATRRLLAVYCRIICRLLSPTWALTGLAIEACCFDITCRDSTYLGNLISNFKIDRFQRLRVTAAHRIVSVVLAAHERPGIPHRSPLWQTLDGKAG